MSEDEDDPKEKVEPTVRYLQKLGPTHLAVILDASRWVFEQDVASGLQVSSEVYFCVSCADALMAVDLLRGLRGSRVPPPSRCHGASRRRWTRRLHQVP